MRSGIALGALGALAGLAGPALLPQPAAAAPARPAGAASPASASPASASPASPIAFADTGSGRAQAFAALRAATRPGALALVAAQRRAAVPRRGAALSGPTTTYFALQAEEYGTAQVVRFRTDGHAHVSRRDLVVPASSEKVVAPTSALGWNLVAMEVGEGGQNVVTVDGHGRTHRLTQDGHSTFGMLTPAQRVVFVTTDAQGASNGLAEVDLSGRGRRSVYSETDRDAVLSLPALSPDGRTAYLVRNVFDRRGLPQSSLVTVDVRSGRVTRRALPGINYVVSVAAAPNGRDLAFVGYRAADNLFGRWFGFRAEADVLPVRGGTARRVAWVDQTSVLFSRGSSRIVVGADGRLVSVGTRSSVRDPLYGTEGLSLPVLAR